MPRTIESDAPTGDGRSSSIAVDAPRASRPRATPRRSPPSRASARARRSRAPRSRRSRPSACRACRPCRRASTRERSSARASARRSSTSVDASSRRRGDEAQRDDRDVANLARLGARPRSAASSCPACGGRTCSRPLSIPFERARAGPAACVWCSRPASSSRSPMSRRLARHELGDRLLERRRVDEHLPERASRGAIAAATSRPVGKRSSALAARGASSRSSRARRGSRARTCSAARPCPRAPPRAAPRRRGRRAAAAR